MSGTAGQASTDPVVSSPPELGSREDQTTATTTTLTAMRNYFDGKTQLLASFFGQKFALAIKSWQSFEDLINENAKVGSASSGEVLLDQTSRGIRIVA